MGKKVTVYSKPNCKFCVMTKNWLEGNGTEFKEVDVMQDTKAFEYVVNELGFQGLPVTEIEGHEPFGAFQPDLLDEYINQ